MARQLRQTWALLYNPVKRRRLGLASLRRVWPAFRFLGGAYRRTLLRRTRVVAVIGSLGKTTTARAVAAALGLPQNPAVEANSTSFVGAALLRVRPGRRHSVIEVGISRPGEMARHAWTVRPDVVIGTSIASEHNRSLGDLEATRAEKFEMVRALASSGTAVLNGDDPHMRWMAARAPGRVLTFGFERGNDVRATDVSLDWPRGTSFTLHSPAGTHRMAVRLTGWPAVLAILAAVGVAVAEGLKVGDVVPALEALGPTSRRLQPVVLPSGAIVLDDTYKGTYETFDAALDVLGQIPAQRRIVIMGRVDEEPGSSGQVYRHIGERVGRLASRVIFLGTRKALGPFRAGARRGGLADNGLAYVGDSVLKAIEAVPDGLGPGDVLLVKGRICQHLERVVLALAGMPVRCNLGQCDGHPIPCTRCSKLSKGWTVAEPVM